MTILNISDQNVANPTRVFHLTAVFYIFVLCIAAVSDSGLLKLLANVIAIGLFFINLVNWAFYPFKNKLPPPIIIGLTIFYIGIIGSTIFSPKAIEFSDTIKFAIAPFFILVGTVYCRQAEKWSTSLPEARLALLFMAILPILALLAQFAIGASDFSGNKSIGMFANRNNAGLYAIALLAFLVILRNEPIISLFAYLAVGLMFGTLGLALAVILALLFSIGTSKHYVACISILMSIILISVILPDFGNLIRVKPVLDSIELLASGRIDLETVTYAQLVQILNTTDLSFLFRLKHWHELLSIYISGNSYEWLFGFGAGAAVQLSASHLVPHNDYLRMLFEFGFITFFGFSMLMILIVSYIGRGWYLVPFLAIAIYFSSDNLINNYIAMLLFFFSAGALVSKKSVQANVLTN